GRVGRRLLVLGAERGWAGALGVVVLAVVRGRVLVDDLRTSVGRRALVHVDASRPVHLRIVLLGDEEFAVGAIERIAEAVTIEVDEGLARGAADVLVGEDHLIDAVKVPLVVGRHLIDPLGHAGIRVAGPYRHRPLVVARTLLRVPGRGVAGPVVEQVQRGIVGDPAPRAAAADLPLITLPGLQAGVLADRLAELGGGSRVDQDL